MKKFILAKKLVLSLLTLILIMSCTVCANDNTVKVFIDNEEIVFDTEPIIENGQTIVPLRQIAEALGYTVEWINERKVVVLSREAYDILFDGNYYEECTLITELHLDEDGLIREFISFTDKASGLTNKITISSIFGGWFPIVNGRTFVPVRFLSENMNKEVTWDGYYRHVYIGDCSELENALWQKEQADKIYIYSTDGSSMAVTKREAEDYLENGWFKSEQEAIDFLNSVELYAYENNNLKTIRVDPSQVEAYLNVGWYETIEEAYNIPVTLYAEYGRTIVVKNWEVEDYCNVGWVKTAEEAYNIPVTLYAADGRTIVVKNGEAEAYCNVGWFKTAEEAYSTIPVTLYSADGRTIVVKNGEVEDYCNVGWYRTKEKAEDSKKTTLYSEDGRTIRVYKNDVPSYLNVGWYETKEAAENAYKAKQQAAKAEKDRQAVYNFSIGDHVTYNMFLLIKYGVIKDINYQTGQVKVRWYEVTDAQGVKQVGLAGSLYGLNKTEWVSASSLY